MAIAAFTIPTCTVLLTCLVSLAFSAPPLDFLPGANVHPGAPVGAVLEPDADTKSFTEYVQACTDPRRPAICLAYEEIHQFYTKLVPDSAAQSLLRDAFAAHRNTKIEQLCSALGETSGVLKAVAVNGTESKYYKTLTDPELCKRRCTDLDENDQWLVRPVCKVLAYELQEIQKRNSAAPKPVVPAAVAPVGIVPAAVAAAPAAAVDSPVPVPSSPKSTSTNDPVKPAPNHESLVVPAKERPSTAATDEKKPPVSITPGTNPVQLAEDVQPLAPISSSVSQKVSTSTTDYSGVLVPNNNEPDDSIKMDLPDTKQAQQPETGIVNEAEPKIGGSLDDDQGGQVDEFMGNPVDADDDDGDYGSIAELTDDQKKKEKPQTVEATKEEKAIAHKQKPKQVGDSYEVQNDRLEDDGHRAKMAEMIDDPFYEETDSNFFAYFLLLMAVCVLLYVTYHNKNKVLGLLLEGRRSSTGRGGSLGSRRSRGGSASSSSRKHTAAYQKLDSNLEEAITSTGQSRTSQIIY